MADVTQRAYRAAYLDHIEEMQPIEIKSRGKESIFGLPYKPYEVFIKTTTKENHERTE